MCSFSDLAGRYPSHIVTVAWHHLTNLRGDEGEPRREGSEERQIVEFLTALALCHTVQVAIQPTASKLSMSLVIFHCFYFFR